MNGIERILVATDLSAPAAWAQTRAALLARAHGAGLDLLHAVSSNVLQSLRAALASEGVDVDKVVASMRAELDKEASTMESAHGVSVQPQVVSGKPVDEILRAAGSGCQLIVAGAHGRHLVHRMLFGSTTERLLYRTDRPLLIVKRSPHGGYRRLLVAVDFSDCALAAARFAVRLVPDADLTLFHAVESPFEGMLRYAGVPEEQVEHHRTETLRQADGQMHTFLRDAGLSGKAQRRLSYGYPISTIEDEVEHEQPDLLVLGKHGRSVIEQLMVGSVTAHLSRSTECDVLVVPEPR